jgi:hypothetical protein
MRPRASDSRNPLDSNVLLRHGHHHMIRLGSLLWRHNHFQRQGGNIGPSELLRMHDWACFEYIEQVKPVLGRAYAAFSV